MAPGGRKAVAEPVNVHVALAALADLDDRAVEHDVSVPLGQRAFLLEGVDLGVAG